MAPRKSRYFGAGLALTGLVAWLAFSLLNLTSYPSPGDDDAFFASIAVRFMQTGRFGFPLYADIYGSATTVVHVGRLYILEFVPVFAAFGVGLFQARLVSWLGGLACTALVFGLGRRLWGRTEAILAALFALLSWQMFWSSHTTRPDTWIGAAGIAALMGFRELQGQPTSRSAFWFGLLTVGMLELHLKTVVYIVSIALGVMMFGRSRAGWPAVAAFIGGGITSAAMWLAIHFLPDAALMGAQWRGGLFAELFRPSADLAGFINNVIVDGVIRATRLGWLEFAYFVAGLAGLASRRSPSDRFVLTALGLLTASYVGLMPYKAADHFMLFRPLLALTTAAGLIALAARLRPALGSRCPGFEPLGLLAAAPLLLSYIGGDLYLAQSNQAVSLSGPAAQIRQAVPPTASILGEPMWWFGFQPGTFTSDSMLAKAYSRLAPAGTDPQDFIGQVFRERGVEYVLLDDRIGSLFQAPPSATDALYPYLTLYTQTHCRPIDSVSGPPYGADVGGPADKTTTIYQCP